MQPDATGGSVDERDAVFIIWTIIFGVIVIGGFGLVAYAFTARQRLRELAIKERIAMIERGLVPAPEQDPARFERLVGSQRRPAASTRAMRYRSAGIVLMGLGFAIIVLLTFAAGVADVALGVGGGLAVLGAAIFVNGMLVVRDEPEPFPAPRGENRRTEPPSNVGP
jgi:hypothetical protein